MTDRGQQAGHRALISDALLPAFAWLLGAQAWRALMTSMSGYTPGVPRLVALASLFLPVLLARPLASRLGPRRSAAAVALLLAIARFATATVGPAAAETYGWVGSALVALYLTIWPACMVERRQAGHALMLGMTFALIEVALTGTLDTAWQPTWWATLGGWLAAGLTAVLALRSLRMAGGQIVESPLPLAMPLALLASVQGFEHIPRMALALGWSVPTTLLIVGLGLLLAVVLVGIGDQLLLAASRPRRTLRWRTAYQLGRTLLVATVLVGLSGVSDWLTGPALALAPAALGAQVGVLLRARPIGLPRLAGLPLALSAWWLTLALALSSRHYLWPVALALVLLYCLATVALQFQDRAVPEREHLEHWTLLAYAVLAVVSLWQPASQSRVASGAAFAGHELRLAVLDTTGSLAALAERLTTLRRWQPGLVLCLPGASEGPPRDALRFDDCVWWLSSSLDLAVYQSASGLPAILARQRADTLGAAPGLMLASTWRAGGGHRLAAAALQTPGGSGGALAAAVREVGLAHYWLLASPASTHAVALPAGYRDLTPSRASTLVWISNSVTASATSQPLPGLVLADVSLAP